MKNRIKTAALTPVAFVIFAKEQIQEKKYDRAIAESQAKIGPYKPATIPVQVWA